MGKFPEADARQFNNVFVCKKCKSKVRTTMTKVLNSKTKCKYCDSYKLRIKRKKK
jgi:ribosomal protein L40E